MSSVMISNAQHIDKNASFIGDQLWPDTVVLVPVPSKAFLSVSLAANNDWARRDLKEK